ncbi:MAG TPA: hypothetical protein VGO63_04015 [Candidatus Paceibacterota bacterium]|jgi:hypothetical protein|nr:hypothetical protein [Candidatus Paceibacterota bacterium]
MRNFNSKGNTNTILIVVVIVIVVVLGVWWYMRSTAAPADNGGADVNVTLPAGDTTTPVTGSGAYQ